MRQGSQLKQEIADLLREWRLARELTQEEMAKKLKRSKRTIVYWENGTITKIPVNYVAGCLGLTVAEFLAGPYPKREEAQPAARVADIQQPTLPSNVILLYMLSDLRESIIQSQFTGWAHPNRIGVPGQVAVRVDCDTPAAKFGDLLLVIPYETKKAIRGNRVIVWDARKSRAAIIKVEEIKPNTPVIGEIL